MCVGVQIGRMKTIAVFSLVVNISSLWVCFEVWGPSQQINDVQRCKGAKFMALMFCL